MLNKIEIPQYNLQVQDLTYPITITDKVGNSYLVTIKESGFIITKISELSAIMQIQSFASNQIAIQ